MRALEGLKPEKVFYYFEEICNIPHGSGNLDKISSYLADFAKERGLFHIRDASNNVIIIKEATAGYEKVAPIILQGHMDMVAVKTNDAQIDLEKDSLKLAVDGDDIYAEGTSLGGDDGIAVAYILALLDSQDIAHPRIEAVITTDEEIGMEGATAIDLSMLKAKRMLNIDSEEEGILLTSCAGGMRTDCHIPVKKEASSDGICLEIRVGGLLGGHSGTEINKERTNAIQLLGITLGQILGKVPFHLVQIYGGEKDNAIPREACAIVRLTAEAKECFVKEVKRIEKEEQNEKKSKEKDLFLRVKEIDMIPERIFDTASTQRILSFLMFLPNGVIAMSADIEGLVETSLNVGILKTTDTEIVASTAIRSAIETAKHKVFLQVDMLTKLLGGYTETHGVYPGWQFDPDSKLRADMMRIYQKMFGKEPKVEALHAGLECGIMISKIPGLDCVSYGPNIYDIHTTKERLSISSASRMWEYLLEILKQK
ncbi:MAG: aminoacyl-histidine dipeptidase [Lachnospiraceae bacterium]|jgi:dipeptidase D|nr:aminoacyl-histidine dipeptidase [Lachnospiraceae bacterium]HBV82149.1 aminoacyl-histidine dipeptidase [Lachnospiraceae bacterium]